MRILVAFLLSFLTALTSWSQTAAPQANFFQAEELEVALAPTARPEESQGLKLNPASFEAFRNAAPARFTWDIRFPDGQVRTLRFKRFENQSEQLQIAVTDAQGFHFEEVSPRLMTYELEGRAGSGTLILMKDHVIGNLTLGQERWEINHRGDGHHALFPIAASTDDRVFTCGVEDAAPLPGAGGGAMQMSSSSLLECV